MTRDLPGSNNEIRPQPSWGRWFRHDRRQQRRRADGDERAGQPAACWCWTRSKKGRVAELLSDQIWLWARGFEGGGPQAELLRRLAHWLMKEPELEAENLSAAVVDGEMVVTRRTMAPDAQPVDDDHAVGQATPSSRSSKIEPGTWRGTMKVERAGALPPHRRHLVGGDGGGAAQSQGSRRHARHRPIFWSRWRKPAAARSIGWRTAWSACTGWRRRRPPMARTGSAFAATAPIASPRWNRSRCCPPGLRCCWWSVRCSWPGRSKVR